MRASSAPCSTRSSSTKTVPIACGYGANVPVISANGMAFNISNTLGRGGGRMLMDPYSERPTGRGSLEDNDEPQGRKAVEAEALEKQQPWEAKKLNEEQMRNNFSVIPEPMRPEVILRFADNKDLLLDGLLDKGGSIAEHAVVVDAHLGQGNVLLFGNNPIYRGETIGNYALVFNAILNHDHLERTGSRARREARRKEVTRPVLANPGRRRFPGWHRRGGAVSFGFSGDSFLCHALSHGKQRQR